MPASGPGRCLPLVLGGVSASGPWGCLPLVPGGCLPLVRGVSATPRSDTPPGRHPLGRHLLPSACWDTHPPAQCMLGYTHTPCPVQAGIWSTNGQYGSHWNAFLFIILMLTVGMVVNIYVAPKHENICFTV